MALSLTAPPPPDAPLTSTPFVTFDEVVSTTNAQQFKLDAWVLPFLNAFVTRGRVKGTSDALVSVDADQFVPAPICTPINPCGTVTWPFEARQKNVENWSGTVGFSLGISRRWNANVDYNANKYLQRVVVGGTFRF